MPRGLKWIEGEVFGKLTVWQHLGSGPRGALWHCQCKCGNLRVVSGSDLRAGKATDCGHCFDSDDRLVNEIKGLQAPCDQDCHYRGKCMKEHLACHPFAMWVTWAEQRPPDPESYPPNRKIYARIFPKDHKLFNALGMQDILESMPDDD